MAAIPKTVATPSAAVQRLQPGFRLANTLLGGTFAMRAAAETYLPRFPSESADAYKARLAVSVLFPAYSRTTTALASKPFSKPLTLDVPAKFEEWLEDIDLQGRNMHAFAADVFTTAMAVGMSGILVEYPKVQKPGQAVVLSQADEAKMRLRPYAVEIKPSALLGWRVARVDGAWVLMQLRFMETVSVEDGAYGEKDIEQVRVITPNSWEVHRKNEKDEWVLFDNGINTLGVVPYVPVHTARQCFMTSKPPLIELAHLNVAHWQSCSDQQNILHVARVPILAAIGVEPNYALVVGAQTATKLPTGADLKFVEHSGAAIGAGERDLATLEERMRQVGAELLVLAPGRVTASQVVSEDAVSRCLLQAYAEQFDDALDAVLQFFARWANEADGGSATLFKDFGAATLAEASAKLLLDMALSGKISDQTLHEEMQRRGTLSSDVTWEDEQERLAAQGPLPGAEAGNDTKPDPEDTLQGGPAQ